MKWNNREKGDKKEIKEEKINKMRQGQDYVSTDQQQQC